MAKSNRDRILQIAQWLSVEFPTPFPVTVRCVKKIAAPPGASKIERIMGDYGECTRIGTKITIRLADRPRAIMIDALLHEWAHAASLRISVMENRRRIGGHDDEWALMYGRIYRRYIDDGGFEASRSY
jgi:hypothetical protein